VFALDGRHRSVTTGMAKVEGLGIGCRYGYRVFGRYLPGCTGFKSGKVLLDPAPGDRGWEGSTTAPAARRHGAQHQLLPKGV